MQVKALDLSFSPIPDRGWVERRVAEGVVAIFQDVWTGGYASNSILRAVAAPNLKLIKEGGALPCIYTNASPWYNPDVWYYESRLNVDVMMKDVKAVMVDIEISDIDPVEAQKYIGMWRADSLPVCTYSADWFVKTWGQRNLGVPYIHARYDGVADYNVQPPVYPLGPLIGKQYLGSHGIEGVSVDAIVMDDGFFIGKTGESSMALSAKAEAGLEAFFATPFTDHYGREWDNFADYLKTAVAFLDKEHLGAFYAALGIVQDVGGGIIRNELLEAVKALSPVDFGSTLEEINIQLQNPPLADIAKAVNDEAARRMKE